MTAFRAAGFAALFLWAGCVWAQDVTLTSRDGNVEISGDLLGFDGEFYRVDTIYGELTVDGSGVLCEGPGCPDLEAFVAKVTFSGAPTVGRVLMPALLEAFAIRNDYALRRESISENTSVYRMSDRETERDVGAFTFRLTNADEAFADLLSDQADMVMTLREVREEERVRAEEAGLGDLTGRNGSRVVALDALVPVVAPSNPLTELTVPQLTQLLSGEIDNWALLGGVDAPVAVHALAPASGLGQAMHDVLLEPADADLVEGVVLHPGGPDLARAVALDPFAIGVTSRSETGNAWELGIAGECGFTLRANRRGVKTEDYPMTSPMFLYIPARRFPKLVREFLSYLRDPSAQLVIRRAGYVDQAPEEIAVHQQGDRFANAIAQAGAETSLEDLQKMVSFLTPLKRLSTTFRFEAGSVRLDAQSRFNVQQLAGALESGLYDERRLVFVGFSDSEGSAEVNARISKRRAEAVRQAVVDAAETDDLSRVSLEAEAFGEAMPMACDETSWGRQVNRRVEVWVR